MYNTLSHTPHHISIFIFKLKALQLPECWVFCAVPESCMASSSAVSVCLVALTSQPFSTEQAWLTGTTTLSSKGRWTFQWTPVSTWLARDARRLHTRARTRLLPLVTITCEVSIGNICRSLWLRILKPVNTNVREAWINPQSCLRYRFYTADSLVDIFRLKLPCLHLKMLRSQHHFIFLPAESII